MLKLTKEIGLQNKDKTIVDKLIKWSLSKLNQLNLYRIKKYGTYIIDNSNNYEALLPNAHSDEKGHYSEPLHTALNTPKVNNIAITGPYGAGKSSFLETFKINNAQWDYLPISLATFKNKKEEEEKKEADGEKVEKENNEEKGKFELHQDIERSILQQFFYREKSSIVPQSRFKKIKRINKFDIFSNTLMFTFLVFWSAVIFNHFKEKDKIQLWDFLNTYFNEISVIYLLIGLAFLYRFFYYISNLQVSKLNLKKGEISLAKQDKASILNEHLDEILYFFEVTKYNVVFFEDIDRFDDTEIFIKLRELNNLINNSKQINRRIIFIYAIRDDMFIDKERTKFFDFIVPIIPYINPSNSEMKLIGKFKQEIKDGKIDESFISQVSLYIDDMRLLLNIYNEYMVYKNNLDSNKLNHNQILALVICKNFYPLDFAKLHTREGFIYDLFANKPKYIEEKLSEYISQEKNLKDKLNSLHTKIESENINKVRELKLIILGELFTKTKAHVLSIGKYNYQQISDLIDSDIFETIDGKVDCIGYYKHGYNWELTGKTTFLNKDYLDRKEIIETGYIDKINNLKKEIESTHKQIVKLKQATLKQLFETSSHIIIEGYEDKDLLIFLVRNGYIDENYEHYISYFHKGGITQDDREFLLSIQNYNALDFTFRLGNISKLLEKLKDKDFEQIEILNYQLTDFLLLNYNKYEDKAKLYFKKLSEGSSTSKEFILNYLEQNASNVTKKEFIKRLKWDGLWLYVFDMLSDEKQDEYFRLIFNALDTDRIIKLNQGNNLKEYLEKQIYLPKYSDEQNTQCKELIAGLELKFTNIENPSDNEDLFNYIYENWNYELSDKMIKIVLVEKADTNIGNLDEAHFTTIRDSGADELINYIDTNLNEYVANIFLAIESNIKESETTILYLLNSDEVSFENKVKIIQKEEVRLSDISLIDNKVWIELLKNNKVEATWDNVMNYYIDNDNSLDTSLINFLNIEENAHKLSEVRIGKKYCEDNEGFNTQILKDIIQSSKFEISSYNYLTKNIGYWYKDLDISTLDEAKITLLVKNNIFQFESECFDILKKYTNSQHIALIEKHKDKFLDKFDEFEIDEQDLVLLLDSSKFEIEEKFSLIENSDLSDIEDNVRIKEFISKFYIDNSTHIEDIDLFNILFYGENKYNLELLVLQIPHLDDCESCKVYLNGFSKGINELLEKSSKHLSIEKSPLNRKLLEVLKKKDCISSFSVKKQLLGKEEFKVNRKKV